MPENPQSANDGRTAAPGMYTYERVAWGAYNVTATTPDGSHTWFAWVFLSQGTFTANVAIPDYVFPVVVAPSVVPSPSPSATPVVTPSPSPTPVPTPTPKPASPGFELVFALAGLLGIAYLVTRKN